METKWIGNKMEWNRNKMEWKQDGMSGYRESNGLETGSEVGMVTVYSGDGDSVQWGW